MKNVVSDTFAQIELNLSLNSQVVFEGVAGSGYMGDIAIDDIMVYHDSDCAIKPASAVPRPLKPTPAPVPPGKFPLKQTLKSTILRVSFKLSILYIIIIQCFE